MTYFPSHNIINADCIDVMRDMEDNCVTMTLTDIPYGVVTRESGGLRNLDKGVADVETFPVVEFVREVVRVTSGSVYIFCGTEQVSEIRAEMVKLKLSTRLCIWEKSAPSPMNGQHIWLSSIECCVFGKKPKATFNEHCKSCVWKFATARSKRHPTEKPLKLFEYLIGVSSNEGDLVFDPCLGSGSSAVAALRIGRKFLGVELDSQYYEIARQRLADEETVL